MKKGLSLLIVGVLVLAIGVGTWVDACTPKRVGYRVIEPSGAGAGLGAGLTVFGSAMVAGGIVIIIKRGKTTS